MAIVRGINRQITIARETTFGTVASGPGQLLRRVNATMQLNRDVFSSQEILPSQQIRDVRLGVRRATASIDGQLSPGTYKDLFEGLLRGQFATAATTGALINVAAAAGPPGTFTRAAGSFLTDGFKVGDVVRWTGWTTTAAANNSRNYRIANVTATVMTVAGVGSETVAAKTAGDSVTCTVVGKKLFPPPTGQTYYSYTLESWMPDADTAISEVYTGMRVQQISISIPATGLVSISGQLVGQDMTTSASRTYASPTALTSSNSLAALNGAVSLNGADVALILGAQLSISSTIDAQPVVGSNIVPDIFLGRLTASGTLTCYVRDQAFYTLFDGETDVDLMFYITTDGTINSPFVRIAMSRVRLLSAAKNDGDRAIIQQVSFQALENTAGGAAVKFDPTSISIQDSSL